MTDYTTHPLIKLLRNCASNNMPMYELICDEFRNHLTEKAEYGYKIKTDSLKLFMAELINEQSNFLSREKTAEQLLQTTDNQDIIYHIFNQPGVETIHNPR